MDEGVGMSCAGDRPKKACGGETPAAGREGDGASVTMRIPDPKESDLL